MSRQRLYKVQYEADGLPAYIEDVGTLLRLSGVVFQGKDTTVIAMFPTACEVDAVVYVHPTPADWNAILERSDDPLIFECDGTGVVKAIHRKAQRVISAGVQWQVYHRDEYRCMYCGVRGQPLTCDHFVPMERGGQDDVSNLLACCRRCNKEKGDRDPKRFCEKKGLDYHGLSLYLRGDMPLGFIEHLR